MTGQKGGQEGFDITGCLEMMETLMGQHGEDCKCSKMMADFTAKSEVPEDWLAVMSKMMELLCGPSEDMKGEVQTA